MIVIHTAMDNHSLLIWGERRDLANSTQLEYCPGDELWQILQNHLSVAQFSSRKTRDKLALANSATAALQKCSATIWLPVAAGAALLSFDLKNSSGSTISPVPIEVLACKPQAAIKILANLAPYRNFRVLAPGVVLGNEIAVTIDLMRLAGKIVAAQQFLPAARKEIEDLQYRAQWQPVFNAAEINYVNQMAGAMPAAAMAVRAHTQIAAADNLNLDARGIVNTFVAGLVDYLVRSATEDSGTPVFVPTLKASARANASKFKADQGPSSVHEAWLTALTSTSTNVVQYDGDDCQRFCRQLHEWQKPITSRSKAPFRLCFRLDEPDPELKMLNEINAVEHGKSGQANAANNKWNVSYHLQSQSDRSLIVPVETVWYGDKSADAILTANGFDAREHLLLSLGQAAKLYPELEQGLRGNIPSFHSIDNESALNFLKEKALLLEDAGFGVLMPSWWTNGKQKLKTKVIVKAPVMKSVASMNLANILQFDFVAAIGDQILTYDELSSIAKLKSPLVKVRGEWIHLDPEHLNEVLKLWQKKSKTITLKDLVGVAIGAQNQLGGILVNEVLAPGWIDQLLKQLQEPASIENLAAPPHLNATLRPYQLRGYSWLTFLKNWGLGACLADDMGLGKTIQTLAMIQNMRQSNEPRKPVLLICPTSVINNWVKEGERFTPNLKLIVHHGAGRARGEKFKGKVEKADIVISSYNLLFRDQDYFGSIDWDGVVLDEAQNIKNAQTNQSKAAQKLKADFRIALTGTPVENNVGDLWALMQFLNPGLLGDAKAFRKNYFYPIQVDNSDAARTRLKNVTQPFILRRMKTDQSIIKDLPDKQESKVYCQLTKEQASLYEAVIQDMNEQLENGEFNPGAIILSGLNRLKQVCNHPAQFLMDNSPMPGRSGKLIRLLEIVQEIIAANEKVLIFSQFTTMHDLLKPFLEEQFGYPVLYLHGGTSRSDRSDMVDRFQSDPGSPIFLLSIKAGGTGLNLTAANHVIHFDRWWNPAVENQATDRAFRIGQKKNVQVHKFVCTGTLEERIDNMIDSKEKIAKGVVGTGEAWLAELSNKDLRAVFALSREALLEH